MLPSFFLLHCLPVCRLRTRLAPLGELLHVAKMLKGPPLLIITTRLPPQFCGVGTYSWLLHQHWPTENSQHRFLVIDGAAESMAALNYPGITEFHASGAELSNALDRVGRGKSFSSLRRARLPSFRLPKSDAAGSSALEGKVSRGKILPSSFTNCPEKFRSLSPLTGSTFVTAGLLANWQRWLTCSLPIRRIMPRNSSGFPGAPTSVIFRSDRISKFRLFIPIQNAH